MIAAGVKNAKTCAECESCEGMVCDEMTGVAVARNYPNEGMLIASKRTEDGCVVTVRKEARKAWKY